MLNTTYHNKSNNNPQMETTDNMNNYQTVQTTLINVNNSITYIRSRTTINENQKNDENTKSSILTKNNPYTSNIFYNRDSTINNNNVANTNIETTFNTFIDNNKSAIFQLI